MSNSNKVDGIITKTQCSHFPLMIWIQFTTDPGPTMIGLLCQATTYSLIFSRLGIQNLRIFALTHSFSTQPQNVTNSFSEDPVTFYSFSENVLKVFCGRGKGQYFFLQRHRLDLLSWLRCQLNSLMIARRQMGLLQLVVVIKTIY